MSVKLKTSSKVQSPPKLLSIRRTVEPTTKIPSIKPVVEPVYFAEKPSYMSYEEFVIQWKAASGQLLGNTRTFEKVLTISS